MNINRINELAKLAAADSLAHGYRDNEYQPFRLMTKAAIEMAECVNAYRDHRYANKKTYDHNKYTYNNIPCLSNRKELYISNYRGNCSNTVQDEMADVAIYCLVAVGHFCPDDADYDVAYKARVEDDFVLNAGFVMSVSNIVQTGFVLASDESQADAVKTTACTIIDFLERWMRKLLDQDLEYWIEQKMEYNKLRPMLHGRKNDPTV